MTALCRRYVVTGETGYVWLRRYREAGVSGLVERNHAVHRHSNQMPEELERMVLELRQAPMTWGPRKLKRILEKHDPGLQGRRRDSKSGRKCYESDPATARLQPKTGKPTASAALE